MEKSKEQQCSNEDKKDDHLKRGRPRKNKKITNGERRKLRMIKKEGIKVSGRNEASQIKHLNTAIKKQAQKNDSLKTSFFMLSSNDFIHPYAHLKNADEAIKQFCDNCRKKLTFINKTEGVQDCNLEWCSLYARRWGKAFVRQLPELHTVRNNSTGKLLLEYKGIQGIHSVQLPQMCIELKCSMCIQSSPIDGQQTKRYNKNMREECLSCPLFPFRPEQKE